MHQALQPGHEIAAHPPETLFAPSAIARKHLMLAAGIGITPFLSFLPLLVAQGSAYELHHVARPDELSAFAPLLAPYTGARIHPGRTGLGLEALLARQPLGTHLYLCGPAPFMEQGLATARRLGWPDGNLHQESFGGARGGAPFQAHLAKSGTTISVGSEESLLEALEQAGVEVPHLCRGGACGLCRTGLVEGEAEHRDFVLTPAERADGKAILPCVSRARTPLITLDL